MYIFIIYIYSKFCPEVLSNPTVIKQGRTKKTVKVYSKKRVMASVRLLENEMVKRRTANG